MRKSRYQKGSVKKQRGRWVGLWWDNNSHRCRVLGLVKDMTKSEARGRKEDRRRNGGEAAGKQNLALR